MVKKFVYGTPFETEAVVKEIPSSEGNPDYGTFSTENGFSFTTKLADEDMVFGLGEANRGINKRGFLYISDCADDPNHVESKTSLYAAHNFIIISGKTHVGFFFDYPGTLRFDIGYTTSDTMTVSCENADLYVYMITGDSDLDIVKQFRGIIGRSYIAPKFAFGYGQSRWGYKTEDDFRTVVKKYRENHVPLDMVYMDIDYMQDYKDFTVNEERFPDFEGFVQDMKKEKIHLVPIIDAGVKVEKDYDIYEEGCEKGYFCRREDGSYFEATVWPGWTHFPDVLNADARKWFGDKYDVLVSKGIDAFWNDMNGRRIFELICEGHSCNETAKIMTADGIECSGNYVNKLWGRPIKDENAPWKMAQVKRIIYNRQYIGEWERTIDGKKKMFSCPVLIDKETFEKAHSKLSVRKYSDHVRGKTPLNPFSNRIFDKDSGIALKLYPHQRLKIRIFRLSYPKPKEIVYERGHIPFDEVYEKVHKIIENEKRQAERIAGMIGSFDWEYEKEIRILKIKAEAKLIFQKMLLIESRNLPLYNSMIAGKISEDEYAMQREVNIEEFEECDEKLQDYLEQIKKIEKCFSKDNLWIKTFSEMIVPEEITRKHVKAWIERIECVRYEEVEVQFKYQDWKERLPQKWFEGDFEDGTKE